MPAKTSKATDNPWAALDSIMKMDPEPVGHDWFTARDFAARYGLSECRAAAKLAAMHLAGSVKRWKGVGAVNRRLTTKYRLK